jgi:hypothetical protein
MVSLNHCLGRIGGGCANRARDDEAESRATWAAERQFTDLDAVLGAAREALGHVGPAIALLLLHRQDELVLLLGEVPFIMTARDKTPSGPTQRQGSGLCLAQVIPWHAPLLMEGSRWWNHRSRACLEVRPSMYSATWPQLRKPCSTRSLSRASSSGVHAPFTSPGLSTCGRGERDRAGQRHSAFKT